MFVDFYAEDKTRVSPYSPLMVMHVVGVYHVLYIGDSFYQSKGNSCCCRVPQQSNGRFRLLLIAVTRYRHHVLCEFLQLHSNFMTGFWAANEVIIAEGNEMFTWQLPCIECPPTINRGNGGKLVR